MRLTPEQFLKGIAAGKSQRTLNLIENPHTVEEYRAEPIRKGSYGANGVKPSLRYLVRYRGHSPQYACDYLNTDYTFGFTICRTCGSATEGHYGSTKVIAPWCYHCDPDKRGYHLYHHNGVKYRKGNQWVRGGPHLAGTFFKGSGSTYNVDKVQREQFKALVTRLFRPIVINPAWFAWNDSTVRNLLLNVSDDWRKQNRDFHERLPVLADALEEAGCTEVEILARCRVYSLTEDKWDFWQVALLMDAAGIDYQVRV